jgi:hypothetical protein
MISEIKSDIISVYNPSQDIKNITKDVKSAYEDGMEILHTGYEELGGLSVIDRMNRDQRTFNSFVDEENEDPNDAWKWRGTRGKARDKAVMLHAQITTGYMVPMFMAQNEAGEEDREMSSIARDITEWMTENSNYKSSFLLATMGMLVNPVTYLGAEYCEVYQKIKEKTAKGYTTKEVLDEIFSGFQAPVYTADQILISNAYEQNTQKQRSIIHRQYIDYSEAEAKYGEHEDWNFVNPGVSAIFNDEDGLFYDSSDSEHEGLVEEVIYKNRRDDREVPFVGGIYMGDNDTEGNPIKHRDNRNAPKYNIVPFGYQRINEHFYFYKSLMNIQYWDNQLLDAQYEMGMNRAFLDTNMPIAISGTDKIDGEVIFPSSVMAFADKDVKVQPLLPQANLGNMFSAMSVVEKSMDESSVSDVTGGQLPDAAQKATALSIAEKNAKTMLQGVGKTMAESITQYGSLMIDIAINHLSIPQVDQLIGDSQRMKYRSFILPKKNIGGKEVSKTLRFDEGLLGNEMGKEEKREREMEMLTEIGYPQHSKHLILINPEIFANLKYYVQVEPQLLFPKNEEFQQAMLSQLYTQLRNDPLVSAEELLRKLLYSYFKGEGENLLVKQTSNVMGNQENTPTKAPAGAMAENNMISSAMGKNMV